MGARVGGRPPPPPGKSPQMLLLYWVPFCYFFFIIFLLRFSYYGGLFHNVGAFLLLFFSMVGALFGLARPPTKISAGAHECTTYLCLTSNTRLEKASLYCLYLTCKSPAGSNGAVHRISTEVFKSADVCVNPFPSYSDVYIIEYT